MCGRPTKNFEKTYYRKELKQEDELMRTRKHTKLLVQEKTKRTFLCSNLQVYKTLYMGYAYVSKKMTLKFIPLAEFTCFQQSKRFKGVCVDKLCGYE